MTDWMQVAADDRAACAMLMFLSDLAHTWDDLYDRDKPVEREHINRIMFGLLVELPRNPFYRAHIDDLSAIFMTGSLGWMVANDYEEMAEAHGLELAHGLRYAIASAITYVAYTCGGYEHARAVLPQALKTACSERMTEYLKEKAHD